MGIDLSKLSTEQLRVYNEAVKTGDTKALKELGFTEAEAESLTEGISTKGLKPGDETSFSTKKETEPEKEEKSSFWGKALAIGGAVLGAGVIGVAALATKGKVKIPPSMLKTLGLGALGTTAAVGLSSCVNYDSDVTIPIDIELTTNIDEIIKWLEENGINKNDFQKIIDVLMNNGKQLDLILDTLITLGYTIDDIMKKLIEQGNKLDLIIQLLQQSNSNQEKILDAITNGNEEIKKLLKEILDATELNGKISAENGKLLGLIFQMLQKLDRNDQAGQALLNQIMTMLTDFIVNQKDANDETHKLLKDILDAITQMDGNMKAGFAAILGKLEQLKQQDEAKYNQIIKLLNAVLAKMDKMDDTMKAGFGAILEKLDTLDDHQTKYFEAILGKLDTMNENDKKFYAEILKRLDKLNGTTSEILKRLINVENINKGNYTLILKILDQIGSLGAKADEILNAIVNISTSSPIDLSEITKLLKQLLQQSQNNGNVLNDIDSKIGLMLVVVQGLNDNLGGKLDTIIAKLEALLGKECNHDDLINILIEIKTIIQNNGGSGGGNNEGILDDLEDLLG